MIVITHLSCFICVFHYLTQFFTLRKFSCNISLNGASQVAQWNAEDMGSIPGSGRSPGVGHGNPLQYSCLENPKDRGTLRAAVHEVTKSRTWLSDHTHLSNTFPFLFLFYAFGPLTFSDTVSFLPDPYLHHLLAPFFQACITMLLGGRRTRQRQWNPATRRPSELTMTQDWGVWWGPGWPHSPSACN